MNVNLSLDKLGRSYGFANLDAQSKRYYLLPVTEVVEELDYLIARFALNEPERFFERLFQIIAHQSYHIEIDERAETAYQAITSLLKGGKGNPCIDKLEDVLNAIGVSIALCRIEDRENAVEHDVLPRACFFQHLIEHERWHFFRVVEMLFTFGFQFRVFEVEASKDHNTLSWEQSFSIVKLVEDKKWTQLNREIIDVTKLLTFFNVETFVRFVVSPPKASPA